MLFKYRATTSEGEEKAGTLEAASQDIAVSALQRRNLIIISLESAEKKSLFSVEFSFLQRIKKRDVVILSRQLSTLFEAKVPTLASFKLLASEAENPALKKILSRVLEDIQGGATISQALSGHPKVFSSFYVSMVRAGEESGKLEEVFIYLANYLERSYELTSKATRALIYPAFVLSAFVGVMIVMMVAVVPKLTSIIEESGQEPPIYTKAVMGLSSGLQSYGIFILVLLAASIIFVWRYSRTSSGRLAVSRFQISIPYLGVLYKKLFLSRTADNLATLISGGVSMVRSLEVTADLVGNEVYKAILLDSLEAVKGGARMSEALARYKEIPGLVSQMIKIGEETGKLDFILKTMAEFYKREMSDALDTLVSLIEPAMIIILGGGVGLLLASILVPIYNIAATL